MTDSLPLYQLIFIHVNWKLSVQSLPNREFQPIYAKRLEALDIYGHVVGDEPPEPPFRFPRLPSLQAMVSEGTSTSQRLPGSHRLRRSPTEIINRRCCIGKTSVEAAKTGKSQGFIWMIMDDHPTWIPPYLYQGKCSNPCF